MRKRQKEEILISFFKEKQKYERLAQYIVRLIKDDPASPKESLHTIIYRIKKENRLIEKIDEENKKAGPGAESITRNNFQKKIGDLLGIRLVCLRLSDINSVKAYLELLADEKILRFVGKPDHKRSFILPVDPGDTIPEGLDLRYSGYSSIHFQVELGQASDAPDGLKGLQTELQLRTIFEEAWGEIDHKYRYVLSRSGIMLPEHIHTGFYSLSAHLQAVSLQAEHLCRHAEAHRFKFDRKAKRTMVARDKPVETIIPTAFSALLEKKIGFMPTFRTLTYLLKRLDESGYAEQPHVVLHKILTEERLQEARIIFREILDRDIFEDDTKRNVDAINAVNFALSDEVQGKRVAKEGLRSVLKWKKERPTN